MRMIGQLDSEMKARAFSDFLFVQGIDNEFEAEKGNVWAIWIRAEEEIERAKVLLADYQQNPMNAKFQSAGSAAKELREKKRKEQEAYEKRVKERRQLFKPITPYGFGPLTFVLIFISVAVFLGDLLPNLQLQQKLAFSDYDLRNIGDMSLWHCFLARFRDWRELLPEIRHGEIWRLFTPMFVHFGFLHIFFNMLWLRDLGSMIEARQGSLTLLVFVLVTAALSNFGEYMVVGPGFGGMSGVVYGLVGYIWMRGKFDPGSGLYLHSSTVTMMMIWFFVCLIGIMGPIANTAHAVGLVMGMAWGFLSSLRHR